MVISYTLSTLQLSSSQRVSSNAAGFSQTRVHSGFTGYHMDLETGLYYARARMYSAGLGRFAGRDPLAYVNGMSLYSAYFVPGKVDPFGLETKEFEFNFVFEDKTVHWSERTFVSDDVMQTKNISYTLEYWNANKCCCESTLYNDVWELKQKKYWRDKYTQTIYVHLLLQVSADPDTLTQINDFLDLSGAGLFATGHAGTVLDAIGLITAWTGGTDWTWRVVSRNIDIKKNKLGGEYDYDSARWENGGTGSSAVNQGCNSKSKEECGKDNKIPSGPSSD